MRQVLDTVQRLAPTDIPILITGESGTGKEVIAKAIHAHSMRRSAPFVVVDCAAIPPTLMESELFGYKQGAFTGAVKDRKGLVEAADGGTFFLDEIGELPPHVQVRLLRLLQDGGYRPVGDTAPRRAQIRTIAATNRDIESEVANDTFRSDLYHRLNGCRIHLPPLRERRADVAPLMEHYLSVFGSNEHGDLQLSPEAADQLVKAAWPGNVRELVNCARYIASLAAGPVVTVADLPPAVLNCGERSSAQPPGPGPGRFPVDLPYKEAKRLVLDEFETAYLRALLQRHGGNVSAAARGAGIDRRSIQRMLKRMSES